MNYQKIYNNLCSRAKTRILNQYCETHHILPKCMGGTNDAFNLVVLTPEEHFLAHLLLVKIYPKNYKLVFALSRMSNKSAKQQRRTGKWYGWTRRRFSEALSISNTGKKFIRKKKYSEEYKLKMSKSKTGIPQSKEHVQKRVAARLKTMYGKIK